MGFLPSSRHHRRYPPSREFPTTRFVPSTGFRNLPTACSTFGFAGLFHPAATSRVSVQGLGPAPQPRRLVAGRASLLFVASLLTGCPAATRTRLSFEAFIHGARHSPRSAVNLPRRLLPSSVFSSSRFRRSHCAPTPLQHKGSAPGLPVGIFPSALPRRRWSRRGPTAFRRCDRGQLVSEAAGLLEVSAFRRASHPYERRSRRRGVHATGPGAPVDWISLRGSR
jgi:hypothetical protein